MSHTTDEGTNTDSFESTPFGVGDDSTVTVMKSDKCVKWGRVGRVGRGGGGVRRASHSHRNHVG